MTNKTYWQSVEEYHNPLPSADVATGAFEGYANENSLAVSTDRRGFLKLMGVTFGAGMAASCSPAPITKAIPYLNKPEEVTPGLASWYASTCGGCSAACGILVKQRDGRPIKIEGNPEHPLTKGGLCAVGQASLFSLYNSKRLKGPYKGKTKSDWASVDADIKAGLDRARAAGASVAVVSSTVTSPSLRALLQEFVSAYPNGRHVTYDAVSTSAIRAAYAETFGKAMVPGYRFDNAKVIVSFAADFLGTWISPMEYTVQYVKNRKLDGRATLSTHIQFESGMSLTGSNADHRVAVNPSERATLAVWLLESLSARAHSLSIQRAQAPMPSVDQAFLQKMVELLWENRGRSLVVSGSNDVSEQIVINRINDLLGSYGKTIDTAHPSLQRQGDDVAMAQLVEDMEAGKVGALFVLDANPAYDYLDGKRFGDAMKKVPLSVSFAGTVSETGLLSSHLCPDHYYLEAWGDAEPRVGLYSLRQPTIAPLFDTRAAAESVLRWMGRSETAYQYLQTYWKDRIFPLQASLGGFQAFWEKSLQLGAFASSASEAALLPAIGNDKVGKAVDRLLVAYQTADASRKDGKFELALYEKIGIRDGAMADNPWLQELPDPVSKISWANYVAISPKAAEHLDLEQGDIVSLQADGASSAAIELPVFIQPGQVMGTVSVALGYGRQCVEKVYGQNAYPLTQLRDGTMSYERGGISLSKTGKSYKLATTQMHGSMEGRDIVLETTLADYKKNPHVASHGDELPALWEPHEKPGHAWGMVIDLNSCTGCSGCVIACQSENNVPVVGEHEIRIKRQMHWLRLDRYYADTPENPSTVFQPMLCQHCGTAPCETVCPVLATTHSSEGLSQQAYNRCVGTRYCANNCPYKVRRFNWFDYAHDDSLANMALNPDVVVRSRGVMEKCTMCIQRIQAGKTQAVNEHRPLRDGDIKTACQQSCPADAIVFGDLNDPESRVAKLVKNPRNYRVLEEVGTKPIVSYLAKVRNPIG